MKKIIIISSALFITVLSGIGFIKYKNITFNHNDNGTAVIEKANKSISEEVKKENTEKKDLQSNNEEEEKLSEKQDRKENSEEVKKEDNSNKVTQSNTSNKNNKKTSSETSTKKETSITKKQEASIGIVDPEGNNKTIDTIKSVDSEPWVKAGVSKEDYYNKPVYSWARVDYPVSKCNSIEKCESLCMKDAEELAYTENVSCIQIFTYSGTYLGEMLKRD